MRNMTTYRVFVTDSNPIEMLQDAYIQSIQKDFDTLEEAYKFACDMFDRGFAISLNAWNEEED